MMVQTLLGNNGGDPLTLCPASSAMRNQISLITILGYIDFDVAAGTSTQKSMQGSARANQTFHLLSLY